MKLLDSMSSIFCFFLGLAIIAGGVRLGLRVHLDMGPGFFPIIAGGVLSLLSILLFFQSVTQRGGTIRERPFWVNPGGWKLVSLTLLPTIAYPFILNYLGFLPSTFLFLFFLFWVIGYQRWWMAAVSGVTASVVVYLIFEIWLKANFPRGVLSF
jgi:putative tricarboxylic transport membrane protein